MKVTKHTSYTLTVDIGEEEEVDLPVRFAPAEWIDPVVERDGGDLTVRYAVQDEDPSYVDDPMDRDGVTFVRFDNGRERDEWLDEHELGPRSFLVERYEHGLVRYSVAYTGYYPDRRWDVAMGVAVLTLDDQWEGDDLEAIANSLLDEYSDWCNGNVYGVVEERFTLDDAGEWIDDDDDAMWGVIGDDAARDYVSGGF